MLVRNPFLIAGSFGFASSPSFTTELELAGAEGGLSFLLLPPAILSLSLDAAAPDDEIESPDEEMDV